MEEPLTCVGELEELALTLETELEPLAAQQLSELLATIRSSDADRKRFVGVPVGVPEEEVVRKVADKCWWFVTAARGQGGFVWGGDLRDSVLTPGFQRDSESRRAAKGGNAAKARGAWALAQLAAKGRGDVVSPPTVSTCFSSVQLVAAGCDFRIQV